MRASALEISWHDSSSVWSVDASQFASITRLVTAGGDKTARVWRLRLRPSTNEPDSSPAVDVNWICDLRAHTSTVNVARFAPCGTLIATAADGGEIALWACDRAAPTQAAASTTMGSGTVQNTGPAFGDVSNGSSVDAERWACVRTLRGHVHDVLDLSWSACGTMLASASVDNSVMVWDITAPLSTPIALRQHSNFVQGVAFHPLGTMVASLGNDRMLRVFSRSMQRNGVWNLAVSALSSPQGDHRLFVDDMNSKNVFRRLAWSPDGNILACPSGIQVPSGDSKKVFAVHVFSRHDLKYPIAQCGGMPCPAVVVRFCPILFELRKSNPVVKNASKCNTSFPPAYYATSGNLLPAVNVMTESADTAIRILSNPLPVTSPPVSVSQPILPQPPVNPVTSFHSSANQKTAMSTASRQVPLNSYSPVAQPPPSQADIPAPVPASSAPIFGPLPYRMIFAVGCTDAIYLYDTESFGRPIAHISGLHLAEHTDICWGPDGRTLYTSSTDGYVSVVSFSDSELGTPIAKPETALPRAICRSSAVSAASARHSSTSPMVVAPRRAAPEASANPAGQPSQPVGIFPRPVEKMTPLGSQTISQKHLCPAPRDSALDASAVTFAINQNGLSSRVMAPVPIAQQQIISADMK